MYRSDRTRHILFLGRRITQIMSVSLIKFGMRGRRSFSRLRHLEVWLDLPHPSVYKIGLTGLVRFRSIFQSQETSRPETSWQMNAKMGKIQHRSVSTSAFLIPSDTTRRRHNNSDALERSTEASYPGLHGLAKVCDYWRNANFGFCTS